MIRSALLRRIYAVILLALVVTAGCTWLLFMLMSRSLFVNIRANEMLPRARSLSAIVNAYMEGRFDENLLLRLVDVNEKDTSIMNAYLIVADREGTISLVSDEKQTLDPQKLENQISEILSGRTVVSVLKSIGGVDIVTLGVPVYALGVPTVVDAVTLAADLLEEAGEDSLDEERLRGEREQFMVTPRDIDQQVRELSKVLGYGINWAPQDLEIAEMTALLG